MDFNGNNDTSFASVDSTVTSDKDDASSFLDLRTAMKKNEQKQNLLQRMLEQQVELQNLQERQKALLKAQQHVSKLDYVATHDLQAKLGRLQAVKQRISDLQNVIDNAEASPSTLPISRENTAMITRYGENGNRKEVANVASSSQNASSLVNEQLEHLYGTVNNLLADIDNMNALNQFVEQQEQSTIDELRYGANSQDSSPDKELIASTTALPYVSLVENESENATLKAQNESFLKSSFDAANSSFVQRHYPLKHNAEIQTQSPSESLSEKSSSARPVSELWEEMRRYQIQLAELQERRKELASYIKTNEEPTNQLGDYYVDEPSHSSYSSQQSSGSKFTQSLPKVVPQASAGISMRYFLGQVKPNTLDASTEKTQATWGGSTSTSGDESVGFISKPIFKDRKVRQVEDQESLTRLSTSIEEAVYDLWDALDYHNNFLNILLDDQKALSVLLQNTLSMQKDHHVSAVLYGISPDFLIYQLDNCSAQIIAYQKQIVMLHKELADLQKQYPEIDVSYTYSKPTNKCYVQREDIHGMDNSFHVSPKRMLLRSRSSTPMKYYVGEGFERSPKSSNLRFSHPRPSKGDSELTGSPFSLSPSRSYLGAPNLSITIDQSNDHKNMRKVETSRPKKTSPKTAKSESSLINQRIPRKTSKPVLSKSALFQQKMYDSQARSAPKVEKPEVSDVDSNVSGYPLFEALRDSIYAEAATLISQNEARPHFLIELFHDLQQLNSDYLRQHCLFMIRDVVNGFIIETPKREKESAKKTSASRSAIVKTKSPEKQQAKSSYTDLINDMKTLYSENTPSESEANSESENPQFICGNDLLQYDYSLDITSASTMSTPQSSQGYADGDIHSQNPFDSDFLGSTVIHLDEALQRVREVERLKQDRSDFKEEDVTSEKSVAEKYEDVSDNVAQLDAHKLDAKIKLIVSKIIPQIKSDNEVCSEEKIEEMSSLVIKLVSDERLSNTDGAINQKSNDQLQSVLRKCLNKFLGYHLSECGEELVIDISEVLFNELAYIYMIENYEGEDEDENKVDDAVIKTMVDEDCNSHEDEEQSVTSINDGDSVSTRSSIQQEDSKGKETNAYQQNTPTPIPNDAANSSVVVDLSVSETKPLTSYGSGEDEEAGSGDEYDQYNETDDVPTSMQHDQSCPVEQKS